MDLIPTRLKYKLSKALTWPIGAEAITSGLGDAPHSKDFQLYFTDSPVWQKSVFQRTLREARPYAVLTADYVPHLHLPFGGSPAAGSLIPPWQLHVNPVPRPWRANVGRLLRDDGLPAVADWLRAFPTVGWEDRYYRLELVYSPADGTLSKVAREPQV